jgi:outer membrane lipopolysaccharide assembly protein LptE/RlpB
MKAQIVLQKLNMKLALNWISLIEVCDMNIKNGNDIDFYKEKKEVAILAYSEVMATIVKDTLELSKIDLENVAA